VLGLVLVDSSHESQSLSFPAKFLSFGRIQLAMIRLCDVLSPVGVVRAFRFWDSQNPPWVTSTQLGQATMSTLYRTGYCKAAYAEEVALMVPGNPGEPGSLGDIPLTVISAGALYEDVPEAVISAMGGPDVLAQVARVHDELQLELVGLSTRGKQIIAPKSGHAIHWDHPELVIGAIRELVQQARAE
jgi:pimeloyl-ACP methyl ester carboxylesterase